MNATELLALLSTKSEVCIRDLPDDDATNAAVDEITNRADVRTYSKTVKGTNRVYLSMGR